VPAAITFRFKTKPLVTLRERRWGNFVLISNLRIFNLRNFNRRSFDLVVLMLCIEIFQSQS
jgi:hypothetical protein